MFKKSIAYGEARFRNHVQSVYTVAYFIFKLGWSSSNHLTGVKLKFLVSNVHARPHLSRIPKSLVYNVYVQSERHLLCLFLLNTNCGTRTVRSQCIDGTQPEMYSIKCKSNKDDIMFFIKWYNVMKQNSAIHLFTCAQHNM